jgi:hypothetical protein
MADVKHEFRVQHMLQEIRATFEAPLQQLIEKVTRETSMYKKNWESVNINRFAEKFTPNARRVISKDGRKFSLIDDTTHREISIDIKGAYCRLIDTSLPDTDRNRFLDILGRPARNGISDRGTQYGRKQSEYNRVTHFRIQQLEEMF